MEIAYVKKNCRATDLSKQTKLKDPKQINFIGKLEEQTNGARILFEKSEKSSFGFLQSSVNIL